MMRIIPMDYEAIKVKAIEFNLPLSRALDQRKQYLQDILNYHWRGLDELVEKSEILERFGVIVGEKGVAELDTNNQQIYRKLLAQAIADAQKMLSWASYEITKVKPDYKPKEGSVTDGDIQRAHEFPVKNLLPNPVKRNQTCCPFHEDRNPSMGIKDNRAHCFACNKTWDSIEIVQELQGLNFIEAVKFLCSQ